MDLKNSISMRLYTLRTQKGWSQEALAEHLNVERRSIGRYENNADIIPCRVLMSYANVFHVSVDYLLYGSDRKSSYEIDSFKAKLIDFIQQN